MEQATTKVSSEKLGIVIWQTERGAATYGASNCRYKTNWGNSAVGSCLCKLRKTKTEVVKGRTCNWQYSMICAW